MRDIKFGLFLPSDDVATARRAALRAEGDNFYSVLLKDHFFTPFGSGKTPQIEAFTTLAAIAVDTKKVRLGTAVAAVGFRTPPLLAKIATTLDCLSNGRFILGLGAGWQREEYDAHGYEYPSNAERIDQMAEAIKVIKAMWTEEVPTYHGKYFSIDQAYNNPRQIQKPYPPIMLGGSGSRLLKVAATEADIVNFIPPIFNGKDFINDPAAAVDFDKAQLKRRIQMLRDFTKKAGRDPDSIEVSGLTVVTMAKDKSRADAAAKEAAASMGFPNDEAARRAPSLLVGTPDEVKQEIKSRIEELGMTYWVVVPTTEESYELFVKEIMSQYVH